MKFFVAFFASLFVVVSCTSKYEVAKKKSSNVIQKVIVAYVTSWTTDIPDAKFITHINYAFGHVSDDFMGVRIDNPERLKELVTLKTQNPDLKVLLSIGGWGSGRFSEMAGNENTRNKFAQDCLQKVKEFQLDGIDIDWEYPSSNAAKISFSPSDIENYTLLMKSIRREIGELKLLTLASSADAKYIHFKEIEPIINYVNIMTYDMANPPFHHAGLYRSNFTQWLSVNEAVNSHVTAGMPLNKLVLGMPFYGHGSDGIASFIDYHQIVELRGYTEKWDADAKAPFLEDKNGKFVCTYESPQSIKIKCNYILKREMLGAMYWDYSGDTNDGILRKTVYEALK